MFKPLDGLAPKPKVELDVDGTTVTVAQDRTLAIALLEAGYHATRRNHRGEPCAPYCLMGVCFECLVQVDGVDNVQSCQVRVRAGMKVCLPQGPRAVKER
ncbi:(2Fe-2S)-binding protein [Parapusillimonas granuli]|uniref:(2Fe-2S)-binding protein n=1 Tax=Parapusillimonas granuli TaxID=380911 RepID=A0A853G6V2_9BURK|nr:(2Fe-2S)-binding protein [Parapusillimonas granuli]MBB5213970.1 putative molibdopterin-dependent oxidoreductase YjgC [Parapusillimonas granuli]NYT50391.1 (2Fe-2S)-binding protein [Parapusillimonas granuli]